MLSPGLARGAIGAGALGLLLGPFLVLGGSVLGGIVALIAGAFALLAGARGILAAEPVPAVVAEALPVAPEANTRLQALLAADEAVKLIGTVPTRLRRRPEPERVAAILRAAADRHRELGWLERPAAAHPRPPTLEKPSLELRHARGLGRFEHLRFESEYEPQDPEVREGADDYRAVIPNRLAHAYLWRTPGRPRPTLICVHGYGMGRLAIDARVFSVRRLHLSLGLDVALLVLPLHGPRARGRRTGAGFFDAHPLWTNAAMGQAIWDLRRLAGWLRQEGAPALGIHGLSLGAYTTALFASLEPGLACAVPALPAASLSAVHWRGLDAARRRALEEAGVSQALLDEAWASHAPLRLEPRLPRDACLIIAAAGDRICPPAEALTLHEHWDRPALHWFPGAHVAGYGDRATLERLDTHLRDTLLAAPVTRDVPLSHFRL